MAFFNVPTAVAYLGFGFVVVYAVYGSGRFGADDAWLVYLVLAAYTLGLLAGAFSRLLQNSFYALGDTATPSRTAVWRVMLSATQVASLLLGLPLLPWDADGGTVRVDPESGRYELTVPLPGGGTQRFFFEQKLRRLVKWEVQDTDGRPLARMTLADYRAAQGQEFPFEIALLDLQGDQEAAIYYEQVELNPPLPPTLFTLATIAGVREANLDAPDVP